MNELPPVRIVHPHVEMSEKMAGSPCVAGTRVTVRRLWAWHRKGVSVETLVKRYPSLGWAKVLAALSFAYDNEELIEADLDRERVLLGCQDIDPIPGMMEQLPLEKK